MFLRFLLGKFGWSSWFKYADVIASLLPHVPFSFLGYWSECPAQCGHNQFDHAKNTGRRFFIILTWAESSNLLVADGSHKNIDLSAGPKFGSLSVNVYCNDPRKAYSTSISPLRGEAKDGIMGVRVMP